MGERMDKRIRFYIYWILGFVLLGACAPGDKEDVYTEMRAFEDFSHINGDSVAIVLFKRWKRQRIAWSSIIIWQ